MGKKKDDDPTRGEGPMRLIEKGNFAHAECDCGWRGPARRSRKKARADAHEHAEDRCKAVRKA